MFSVEDGRSHIVLHNSAGCPAFRLTDDKHKRYTDRYTKGATAVLSVVNYDGSRTNSDPWVSITLEEIQPRDARGVRKSKVISITLDREERAALLKVLTEMEITDPDFHRPVIL